MNKAFKISENITFEFIDTNIFILNIEDGKYFKLSDSASLIWKEIEKGLTNDGIKKHLKSKYGENEKIDNDIDETISKFIKLGFISDH
jgi:hypothetical protein